MGYMPQIRSLSVSGSEHASLVVGLAGKARDLRLTTDGGQTWRVVSGPVSGGAFECATLIDDSRGWAINRHGQVFATNSAGANWTKIAEPEASSKSGESLSGASRIEFVNDTEGWVAGGLSIWHTKDGGVNWREVLSRLTPGVKGDLFNIYAIDANTLVCAATGGQVYTTRDAGESWNIQMVSTSGGDFTDVWFKDNQNGWLTGYVGEPSFRPLLFATKDGGASWEELPLPEMGIMPKSVSFVDGDGWLAGHQRVADGKSLPIEAVLLHTTDAGKHWIRIQPGADDPFFSMVRFSDVQHGWLVGRDNLYRTEDGGKTWQRVLSVPPAQLY